MSEEQGDPPEIPSRGEEELPEASPLHSGELLPPEGSVGASEGIGLDFDDLPDPPGGPALGSAFSPDPEELPSLEAVYDVPVRVQAVLGRTRMPIAELVAMRPGHVFELDRRVGEPIDILVNDRLIARGEIVMIDGALGVTLTEIVRQDA